LTALDAKDDANLRRSSQPRYLSINQMLEKGFKDTKEDEVLH